MLADQPTGNLDPATGNEVLKVLRELQQTGNQTLILVTHDPELAALADRRLPLEQLSRGRGRDGITRLREERVDSIARMTARHSPNRERSADVSFKMVSMREESRRYFLHHHTLF